MPDLEAAAVGETARLQDISKMEPAGFEPATSCLQNPAGGVQQER
jgi:hypothetical protein